ncbi:FAD-binding protein [Roseinatronobacter bogoriensis]|uniref:FAD-binding protein n=1 Tax=Roseinatronobacter bogoriensis subsp. barguzinensis TaxID=441209 RepID=A0A2K8KEH7_9RHOB|nr:MULTISPECIES: FAD-binding protein [Rhodobaca]ATX67809.1 FAD-binding protein [Rhodobaca barguzinensis]MBB4207906.1 glycolate oxidase FAD binding subunit [Rhodobaca bogoriensis DSM 18756]TDW38546.1 glycolate oxidase FAD binding subunit [Rhodobaca barguzinensis]TDY69414.1 glycolate oxidase FAD binding subunit [Rhodobaca bogoriensis DSM 18756]
MRPASEQELSDLVRDASGPLRICGGGTRAIGRPVVGEPVLMSGLSGITLYEPGALTLVAQAGTPLAEVERATAAEGQRLAFEPMDMQGLLAREGVPTVGGMVAANASGPRRVQAGGCRDSLIGVRFVDGSGTIIKNGGRVMKNVTGYDLVKLMAGSWGTLGVLTECSFKLLPIPETQASLVSDQVTPQEAVDLMSRALATPYEVNGAARALDGRVYLRLEGFARQVGYRSQALREVLGGDWELLEGDKSAAQWRGLRDVADFAAKPGDVWRVSVKPSDAPELVARANCPVVMDWGGGLIWALVPEGTDLRRRLGSFAGHATLIRGSEATRAALPVFQPEADAIAALARGLRAKFDPRGVLNPGLMG